MSAYRIIFFRDGIANINGVSFARALLIFVLEFADFAAKLRNVLHSVALVIAHSVSMKRPIGCK